MSAPVSIYQYGMTWPNSNGLRTPATPKFGLKIIPLGLKIFHLADKYFIWLKNIWLKISNLAGK
jgi:hypothetical protein